MSDKDKPDENQKLIDPALQQWPDNLPPCMIFVDTEGRFWHQGAAMIHEGINKLITEHVELDEKDRYVVDYRGQRCFVEVEDTFFVINRLDHDASGDPETFFVTLNDGEREELDVSTLKMGKDNVIYAQVKGRFPARFVRKSYYQLAEHIIEKEGAFTLPYRGNDFIIITK